MRVWSDERNPVGCGEDAVGRPVLRAVARSFPRLLPLEDNSLNAVKYKTREMRSDQLNDLDTISVSNFTKFSHVHVSLVCKNVSVGISPR